MNLDRLILILLAVFFMFFGIATVTDMNVLWSKPIIGYSAMIIGVVCIIRGVK